MGSLVSSVGDLFGANSSANSANTIAQSANLTQPVTQQQVGGAIGSAVSGLGQQQDLVNALGSVNGINNLNNVYNQQQGLQSQLQGVANGTGPNPALAQLNQTTGQNVQNQAALMAGQRGAGANVGLLARQAAEQGANTQQQAVGQGATLAAQQQLAGLGALQSQQAQLANTAATQVGQQQGALNSLNQAAQGNQGQLLNALGGYNQNQVQNTASQNSANAGIAQTNANNTQSNLPGLISGIGQAATGLALGATKAATGFASGATGGEVGKDKIKSDPKAILAKALSKKIIPNHLKKLAQIYHPKLIKMAEGGDVDTSIVQPIPDNSREGNSSISSLAQFAPEIAAMGANKGAEVPGKPKYPGKNTIKQDSVPALLTPKEIVLPLTVTQAKNPGAAAKAFVEHIKGKDKDSDFKDALRAHIKNRKFKA